MLTLTCTLCGRYVQRFVPWSPSKWDPSILITQLATLACCRTKEPHAT